MLKEKSNIKSLDSGVCLCINPSNKKSNKMDHKLFIFPGNTHTDKKCID